MKTIIILADGMADYPIEKLGGKTPLMAARTPAIDRLCARSRCGRLVTVPDDMPPGSEVANLAVLGYDVHKVYQGRGVLEAASIGVELAADDLAMRCNIICIENGRIKNHSAGHISSEESLQLVEALNEELAGSARPLSSRGELPPPAGHQGRAERFRLHAAPRRPRHAVHGGPAAAQGQEQPNGRAADRPDPPLPGHPRQPPGEPANARPSGKDPGNSIWPWSPGHRPQMKTFRELYGLSGAVISAVDLIFGLGVYAGLTADQGPGRHRSLRHQLRRQGAGGLRGPCAISISSSCTSRPATRPATRAMPN